MGDIYFYVFVKGTNEFIAFQNKENIDVCEFKVNENTHNLGKNFALVGGFIVGPISGVITVLLG